MLIGMGFVITLVPLLLLFFIRNEIVYRVRVRAIDVIFDHPDWMERRKILLNPSYNAMLFDLTRWTFKQFYPGLYSESR